MNVEEGRKLYAVGDAETRDWFERQLRAWPVRVNERLTTNISLLYGGVLGYRDVHGHEPRYSRAFAQHVRFFDSADMRHRLEPLPLEHTTSARPLTKRQKRRARGASKELSFAARYGA